MKKQLESTGSEKDSEIGRLNEKLASVTAELETVKGCKMCDLEDTIDVQKYYTRS